MHYDRGVFGLFSTSDASGISNARRDSTVYGAYVHPDGYSGANCTPDGNGPTKYRDERSTFSYRNSYAQGWTDCNADPSSECNAHRNAYATSKRDSQPHANAASQPNPDRCAESCCECNGTSPSDNYASACAKHPGSGCTVYRVFCLSRTGRVTEHTGSLANGR